MATPTIQPTQIKTGPGAIYYKIGLVTMPVPTAVNGKVVYNWSTDTWVQVGATDAGLTYTESASVEDVRVAESLYPVRRVTTEKTMSVSFAMSHIHDLNWKLAMNGGTITTSGSAGTKLNKYVPPLMGQEIRVSLGFHSYEEDELMIWPQVFNGGSVETARSELQTKGLLPVEFGVELPDATILDRPYARWTAGALAQSA